MLLTQHFAGPRWKKEWLPLATQQLRLRNLIKILAFRIRNDKKGTVESKGGNEVNGCDAVNESYYFTLHSTTMSAPFYTSEKLKSDSPKWKELDIPSWEGSVWSSVDAVVIRLWFSNPQYSEDRVLAVWGVYLSGLFYLGPSLKGDVPLKPNSIVFLMPGGYFTDPKCLLDSDPKVRYSSVIVNNCDVRLSYSVNSLRRLQTIQHVIKKEMAEVEILKKKITMGDFFRSENRSRTALRKLLNKHKPKTNHVDVVRVKESIEMLRYQVGILREERDVLQARLNRLDGQIKSLAESNQSLESKINDQYNLLRREVHMQREWKRSYIDRREKYLHSKAMLNFRTKQLISELNLIYPIVEVSPDKYTICGVHLPNSEDFAGHDDLQISTALGFVTHIIQMISVFLQIPLRYPVVHFGSRSRIIDHITDKVPDSDREFCLYAKGKEKLQFHYAVYLLNKNIAQMRWLCGLPTSDLRNTLENLSTLVKLKCGSTALDQASRSLSSSTADVCSSNLSVSSPLGSVLSVQSRKCARGRYASESGASGETRASLSPRAKGPGHRVSKSVGSTKDLMTNMLFMKNKDLRHVARHGGHNLSCSLDKGLNEFEDGRLGLSGRRKEEEQFGSEPTISCSGPGVQGPGSRAPEGDYKDMGNSESHRGSPSEDESGRTYPTFDTSIRDTGGDAFRYEDVEPGVEVVERPDDVVGSVETQEDVSKEGTPIRVVEPGEPQSSGTKAQAQVPILIGDSLLESVTNRTEALVSQTTPFNRYRSRFKSTLESSN